MVLTVTVDKVEFGCDSGPGQVSKLFINKSRTNDIRSVARTVISRSSLVFSIS